MDKDLKNKTLPELKDIIARFDQRSYLAEYLFNFIHARHTLDPAKVTPLSKQLRENLDRKHYYISTLKVKRKLSDPDGTVKYLFELPDGCEIESVLLSEANRKTLCISTQVGCRMNCQFCATGKLEFIRNLTTAEIVDQVYNIAEDESHITNIVYMGMGEPLDNYWNLIRSLDILNHPKGLNIGKSRITVSTCGHVGGIEKLAHHHLQPVLAVSLNAPDDKLRSELMPINKRFGLKRLFKALEEYQKITRMRITFEYVLIDGVNDTSGGAQKLLYWLNRAKCHVNLIEFNPYPGCSFRSPDSKNTRNFASILKKAGIETSIRFKKGRGVKAACGQLGAEKLKNTHKTH